MKVKKSLIVLLFFFSFISFAQKGQRVAYIDMNYILENVPEYVDAQSKLDSKISKWQQKLDVLSKEIETQKIDLSNEKSLLTKELIREYEEDILIKENELRRLQNAYFGPTGDLFQLRNQLAKPVQDQVYNAVQEIAVRKKYDFVLDKSSDLILLYSNNKFDISELVLNTIVKGRKRKELDNKKKERIAKSAAVSTVNNIEPENV
ncbi:MAG: OmpH family outer membrane protein, partial [Flavobacteriaceae bacterium]|nr:OmpH family outer membrane protein [Flavobacteriaceae bacterium]